MSIELERLKQDRDLLRQQERALTDKIKKQRRIDSQEKKNAAKVDRAKVGDLSYMELSKENGRLRSALAGALKNTDSKTYKRLGEDLNVSSGRARELYGRLLRSLRVEQSNLAHTEE
jgi:DNA-directed RNA polymerase sigma subunit (sigma70/sigma32)